MCESEHLKVAVSVKTCNFCQLTKGKMFINKIIICVERWRARVLCFPLIWLNWKRPNLFGTLSQLLNEITVNLKAEKWIYGASVNVDLL